MWTGASIPIHSEIGMDGEIVGRKIEPTISRIQAKGRK